MHKIDLALDVTDQLPAEVTLGHRLSIAAWVFTPDTPTRVDGRPAVIALINGGTYDKRYFHAQIPGRAGYSVAEHLAGLGYVVILTDYLGVGESSRAPKQMRVTRQVAALANHAAITQVYELIRQGKLHPDLPATPDFLKVGGGHSMGGMTTITQQAENRTFDRLLVLGYTAIGVHTFRDGVPVSPHKEVDETQADYWLRDRKALRMTFHWEDVPDDVLAYDDSILVEVPYMLSTQSTQRGIVTADAGRIEVPVYICLGERDVSPEPYREPSFYTGSKDVTLHILPNSGHCQSFASTRNDMLDRIDGWIRSIPA